MRFQRLLLEAGSSTVTLDLHPRLTVVAGLGRMERESLVTELLGGLGASRPGTHVEVVEDTGRRLGVIHPAHGGRDRVMDLASNDDVTEEFAGENGSVNLLQALGFDVGSLRRRCRMGSHDMATGAVVDSTVATLAGCDPEELWTAAEAVQVCDAVLKAEVAAIGGDPEDASLVEEVERRHAAFEAAQERLEYVRHHGIFIGGACVLAAMPAALIQHWASIPLLAVAIVTTLVSIAYRRRMEKTRKAERRVLEQAGAKSYLAFRIQRMNAVFDGGADRTRLALAADEHRRALAAWRQLAGEVSVDLAFDLRDRVEAAARRIREAGGRGVATAAASAEPTELAQALMVRMNELRHAGSSGESFPLLLDEPLQGIAPSVKHWVLELVGRSAGTPQIVYLTDDPEVAAWARAEAVWGELSVLEPAPA
ncbi:MAG: hypothetical protein KY454_11900 [Actinobacteria bacterium]|nr:hypothetical protein [Actinomycetota bacterium]MBW3650090.1 hypothetical protein [Actinomycetota bacterium]